MSAYEVIMNRKSIRAFLDKPVSEKDLEKIVETGRWAPNAGAFQLSVVRNAGLIKQINEATRKAMLESPVEFLRQRASLPGYEPLYGAPVLILISGPKDLPSSPYNAALAAENMLLEATELGLGSCFLMSITRALDGKSNTALEEEAGIPGKHKLQCGIIIGYAADENKFSLGERKAKGKIKYID